MNDWRKDVIDRAEASMLSRREDEQMSVTRMIERDKARQCSKDRASFAVAGGLGVLMIIISYYWRVW
jgi:hypothetical protein